jgi:hypothetical protein
MKRALLILLFFASPFLAADEVARLHALFDRTWETRLRESPMFATSVGRHEYDDRLGSMTPADLERHQARTDFMTPQRRSPCPASESRPTFSRPSEPIST